MWRAGRVARGGSAWPRLARSTFACTPRAVCQGTGPSKRRQAAAEGVARATAGPKQGGGTGLQAHREAQPRGRLRAFRRRRELFRSAWHAESLLGRRGRRRCADTWRGLRRQTCVATRPVVLTCVCGRGRACGAEGNSAVAASSRADLGRKGRKAGGEAGRRAPAAGASSSSSVPSWTLSLPPSGVCTVLPALALGAVVSPSQKRHSGSLASTHRDVRAACRARAPRPPRSHGCANCEAHRELPGFGHPPCLTGQLVCFRACPRSAKFPSK